jgi:ubiquinone/menaquinone biosynthesis C-methylase UbiE
MSRSAPSASEPDLATIAAAFSRAAPRYDGYVDDHPHLARMRAKVHALVVRHTPAGARILELNAGSGIDAVELARRGFRVHATDVAPGMLERIAPKAALAGVADAVSVQACSFLDLNRVDGPPFDAVLSNLGGLNCAPDLALAAREIDRVLAPGGVAVLVVMPRVCLWELGLLLRGRFRTALRRWHRGGTRAHVEGRWFTVHYFSPRAVRATFGAGYEHVCTEGLSVVTPPGDAQHFPGRHPTAYRRLAWLDDRLAPRRPFSGWGDFAVTVLRRVPVEVAP